MYRGVLLCFFIIFISLSDVPFSLITFSNQTVLLMVMYTLVSFVYESHIVQDIISLYGYIMFIIFYGVIVPMNDWSTNIEDLFIHFCIPTMFILRRHGRLYCKYPHWKFVIYPILYTIFIYVVSFRRGYWIYPFLGNPVVIGIMVVFFDSIYWLSQYKFTGGTAYWKEQHRIL